MTVVKLVLTERDSGDLFSEDRRRFELVVKIFSTEGKEVNVVAVVPRIFSAETEEILDSLEVFSVERGEGFSKEEESEVVIVPGIFSTE